MNPSHRLPPMDRSADWSANGPATPGLIADAVRPRVRSLQAGLLRAGLLRAGLLRAGLPRVGLLRGGLPGARWWENSPAAGRAFDRHRMRFGGPPPAGANCRGDASDRSKQSSVGRGVIWHGFDRHSNATPERSQDRPDVRTRIRRAPLVGQSGPFENNHPPRSFATP